MRTRAIVTIQGPLPVAEPTIRTLEAAPRHESAALGYLKARSAATTPLADRLQINDKTRMRGSGGSLLLDPRRRSSDAAGGGLALGTGDYDDLWRACANLATGTRENALQCCERRICHQHAHNIHG